MVQWEQVGWVFPEWMTNKNPQWGASDFWAPELHVVDQRWSLGNNIISLIDAMVEWDVLIIMLLL